MNRTLLYSGGMDSLIAWKYLNHPPTLYAALGHRYMGKELVQVQLTIPSTKILYHLGIGKYEKSDAEIPARNLLLVAFAALEGADVIYLIVQQDEMSIPDRTVSFLENASKMMSHLFGRSIQISTPFQNMDKTDMVEWYAKEGGDIRLLLNTISCYADKKGHCGDCSACFRRFVALMNNDIDPGYSVSEEIKQRYRDRMGTYSEKRQKRMKPWI